MKKIITKLLVCIWRARSFAPVSGVIAVCGLFSKDTHTYMLTAMFIYGFAVMACWLFYNIINEERELERDNKETAD